MSYIKNWLMGMTEKELHEHKICDYTCEFCTREENERKYHYESLASMY